MKNFVHNIQSGLDKIISPLAKNLSESKLMKALMPGMMATLIITMGVAVISILVAIPFQPWQNLLTSTGLANHMNAIVSATTGILALYIVPGVAYHYAHNEGENGLNAAILALAVFIALQPQNITVGKNVLNVLQSKYLGNEGIFVGMLTGIIVSVAYVKLMKKNIKMKLPDSVPTMVSDSLSPIFVSMIIFVCVLVVRVLIGLTPFGNIFDLINKIITYPVSNFAATVWAIIIFQTVLNVIWFFGIHPAPLLSVIFPILLQLNAQNITMYLNGTPASQLPYASVVLIGSFCFLGAQGNTVSLAFLLTKAKSEKFKAIGKVALIPNIFNINEPIIFGLPVMLNPYFLLPMLLTPLLGGIYGVFCLNVLHVGSAINPVAAMSIPWVVPSVISAFLIAGWRFALAIFGAFLLHGLIWYPFFKIADKKELESEKEQVKENAVSANNI
ncbi:PTS system, cellobiose-specific IIC component [Sharpea azabuensis]|uniref:PTS sugar transporter subunit IIC n=1 Tax=Sharpea azabuensis TaxID=322505 RepID=UPI0008F1D66B|nr:PTS transporter subunit EIIC [Sharpea azabuensis]HAJ15574.1 PTS sugar transporter subunit IIC [Erysipelotrichaceae bacterium]SFD84541.1 PTS system, cellobiose-specific IIC component [Sharpea azabuensis]SFK80122.1 PTS system, cellobiose-specific IIC component [Sharpea azabuensis]HAV17999.1 PTS sugar transporter subunit IIC [Erysipelotrichaceae bacterium]HBG84523.1 PTS sugar transporter subunit IIC [Erysipelotrichaceae bacterium]